MKKVENLLNLTLLNVGHAVHRADWNFQNVCSPFIRIFLVRNGSAWLCLPDGEYELKPNCLYLIPAFVIHSYRCDSYFELDYIHIYEVQEDGYGTLDAYNFATELPANEFDVYLATRLLEINKGRELMRPDPASYDTNTGLMTNIAYSTQMPLARKAETRGILLQLFSRFIVTATKKHTISNDRILSAVNYIRANINEKLSTQLLADQCFLSEDHFIRLFKEELSCTPQQYIIQKKIEKAQLMLTIGSVPIKAVCYKLSFNNISYFNRLFKSITGFTPVQYRNNEQVKL